MALLRTMSNLPYTLEMLAWKFLSYIPKGYYRVDLVADCYFKNSMKDAERSKRSNIKEDSFSVYIHIVRRKQDKVDRVMFETISNENEEVLEMLVALK